MKTTIFSHFTFQLKDDEKYETTNIYVGTARSSNTQLQLCTHLCIEANSTLHNVVCFLYALHIRSVLFYILFIHFFDANTHLSFRLCLPAYCTLSLARLFFVLFDVYVVLLFQPCNCIGMPFQTSIFCFVQKHTVNRQYSIAMVINVLRYGP